MPSFRNLEQTLKELCNLFMRTIRCISEAVINLRYWWAGPFVINLLLDTGKNIPMPRSCMKMMSGSRSENGWNNTELSLCAVTTYGMSFEKLVFTELGQNGSDLPEGPYKRWRIMKYMMCPTEPLGRWQRNYLNIANFSVSNVSRSSAISSKKYPELHSAQGRLPIIVWCGLSSRRTY